MDTPAELVQPEGDLDVCERKGEEEAMEVASSDVTPKSRHILELISHESSDQVSLLVNQAVVEQLRNWGIDFELPAARGRPKVRKSNSSKGKNDIGSSRLVQAQLTYWNITVLVPVLIKETCDFLRNHIKTEGIFRKSGSASRVQALMQRFANLEVHEDITFTSYDSVFDVATALKQYLREMEFPLIPYDIHGVFRKCLEVPSESTREEALILSTCLLPAFNISILTYLIEFLMEVVQNSSDNRMSFQNLAIVVGPNVMPVESKRSDKTKDLENERKLLEAHTKVLEMLIRNGHKVGTLPLGIEKKIEANFSLRGSEDELENDGTTRRKKRRSGSLTRVLGFLKKVASNKNGETPLGQTPGGEFSDFTHTPIIKSVGKRRCLDENIFSLQKKKTILDGIRKNGLVVQDDDKRFSHITATPNSIAGFITCPSPVCLNPSPMKSDWKQTPNTARFRNLVTPSLLRRKDKNGDLGKNTTPFSAPAKPVKSKLLGKKSSKKQPPNNLLLMEQSRRDVKRNGSSMSIHKLATSPRKVARASSTRIPRPEKMNPVRKSNSSCRFPVASPRDVRIDVPIPEARAAINLSGEYVTLSPTAQIRDEKNEAFIASKLSCLEDSVDQESGRLQTADEAEPAIRLTPLIQEITTLTLTAQEELTLSVLRRRNSRSTIKAHAHPGNRSAEKPPPLPSRNSTRRRSSGASNKAKMETPPSCQQAAEASTNKRKAEGVTFNPTGRNDIKSKTIREVEDKFKRAIKETKIMRIQSENNAMRHQVRSVNIHRRFSVQDKGYSPSQRRIISVARRRSHELSRTATAGVTTPLANDQYSKFADSKTGDSISRSPNRCTLKRGRPNTLRSGLARPSPVASSRNNSDTVAIRGNDSWKENPSQETGGMDTYVGTPLRRMSSVQELVKLMEKGKIDKPIVDNSLKPVNRTEPKRTLSRKTSSSTFLKPPAKPPRLNQKVIDVSTPRTKGSLTKRECKTLDEKNSDKWVSASDFNFETYRKRLLMNMNHNEDRDSIQALKTLNAGKVSENVRLFDGMCRTRKSPGKSLIPRLVSLHRQESFKNNGGIMMT